MSSTKRGGKRSPADNYPTPRWSVDRLLEEVKLPGGRWFEPGCGDGDIIQAVWNHRSDVGFTGVDKRNTKFLQAPSVITWPQESYFAQGDLLKLEGKAHKLVMGGPVFDVSIGNPAFRIAPQVIELCLARSRYVALLLRLNYVGSDGRSDFMHTLMPDVYVLPNRPSFKRNKKTDSIEYAWMVWGPLDVRFRNEGKMKVLATTPKEVRNKKWPSVSRPALVEPTRNLLPMGRP